MGFFDSLGNIARTVFPVGAIGTGLTFLAGRSLLGGDKGPGEAYYQQQIANAQLAQATTEREQAISMARRSPAEIELRNNLNQLRLQTLGQGQREIDFLQRGLDMNDPGAAEAGRGLFSSIMLRQRQAQKELLQSSLRQRFGAGYATTSAGQAALQQFDTQTADLATSMIPQILQSQSAAISQQAEYENLLTGREISAANRTSLVPYAGSQYVGGLIDARQRAINEQSQAQMLGTLAGAGLGVALTRSPQGALMGAQIGNAAFGGGTNLKGVSLEDVTSPRFGQDSGQNYSFINANNYQDYMTPASSFSYTPSNPRFGFSFR